MDGSTVIATLDLDIADLDPEVGINLTNELILEGSDTVFGVDRIDMYPDDLVEFRWDWDGDGQADETTYEANATHRFDVPGERTVILEVVDEDGSTAHAFRMITVTNVGPIAVLQIDDAAEGQEAYLFGGNSIEPGDDIVAFRWDMDGDGEWDASIGDSINWTWYSSGSFPVVLEVEDEAGATHRVTETVIISDVAPTADAGGPYEVSEGQPLLLSAGGSIEPGDDIIEYSWDLDGDGEKETTSISPELEHSWDEPGRYSLTLTVLDEDGSSGTSYFIVTVLDAPPTFDLVLPEDVMEGVAATFEVINLHDPGTETFAVTWHFGDDEKELGSSVVHTYVSHGSYSGHVTVRDNEGTVAHLDWPSPLVVASSSPIFTLDSYTWNLTEDETFTYDLVVSAPYGSTLTFSFEGRGGKLDPETGRFTWTPTDADVGDHTFTFSVEDEGGDGGTAQVVVSVQDVEEPNGKEPDGKDDPSGSNLTIIIGIIIALAAVAVIAIALVLRRRTSLPPEGEGGSEEVEATEIPPDNEGR
jgi:PKD repeat protein